VSAVHGELDRSCVGTNDPEQHPGGRGLASSVRTKECEDLSFLNMERKAVDGPNMLEVLGDGIKRQNSRVHGDRSPLFLGHHEHLVILGSERVLTTQRDESGSVGDEFFTPLFHLGRPFPDVVEFISSAVPD
jgi:hypothetical protein